ncbi:enoyl-CoA hydratase/isomerase family protein [Dehalobacterium formicoaceticum]|uniref:Enoyl-CoA hydratase/isomerase family protein n=1 Tax=Dehalobacterium formicoaceticum TaxID=51515 RepID=A0ABT1YAJ6_9FIRM|nr:enoyl-CoA hydratase/isomerase family protein [Dehalobacterium formicoaceticum]MCR6546954.1 enoyl-CoA hydratase/isomerase family protein [Dehalobacterium formicoaceticum]
MAIVEKQYESFKIEQQEDNIAIISLNRGDMANAFLTKFPEDLYSVLSEIADSSEIKAIILKDEGKIFSAGAHFDVMKATDTPYKAKKYLNSLNKAVKKMYDMPQPIIAVVDGAAAGGGANLALSCDFIFASEKAKFLFPFVNLGLMPDTGGLWTLTRLAGVMRTKEIAMRGLTLNAQEAMTYGLVTKIVPSESLFEEAMSMAKEIADKPKFVISTIKSICNKISEMTHEDYCQIEEGIMSVMFFTKDHEEGLNAFLEKRKANFQGEE